jgi:hypothetical protein
MDSTSTYYAVGLISLIVATLLFIMYINVINMDLAMDEKEEDKNNDSSVQYIPMDRQRKNNRRRGDDERHAKEVADQTNTDNLLGKDGHGQQKDFSKKPNWHPYGEGDHPGGVKSAEGFLPAANDITVKHKLQTGSENIRNTL